METELEAGNSRLQRGVEILKEELKKIPNKPGVYRMLDENGGTLYVGKAKNLKVRLKTYTQKRWHSAYIPLALSQMRRVEITVVAQESDALLLEAGLIGELKPRYNILFRSYKTFPYIFIAQQEHPFPRLTKYRGKPKKKGYYFGPFTSQERLNESTEILQKIFLLRSCPDHFFSNRTRPCLLYQIHRCSAPCVGKISEPDYKGLIEQARDFFNGENKSIKSVWKEKMLRAAEGEEFEQASFFRDRLMLLKNVENHAKENEDNHRIIAPKTFEQADVIACHIEGETAYIQIFFFRSYQNLGNTSYTLKVIKDIGPSDVLSSFIPQFYRKQSPPKLLITHALNGEDKAMIEQTFSMEVVIPQRGEKKYFLELAIKNAQQKGEQGLQNEDILKEMAERFRIKTPIRRIEIYDNSHNQGAFSIGAMVVYTPEGFDKKEYRTFNMKAEHRGDDLAMMKEVFRRRFEHTEVLPDCILIDGGGTQLSAACEVLAQKQLGHIPIVSIAKGRQRNAGRERFFLTDGSVVILDYHSPLMHFLQRLRDEAHRFAIGTYRRSHLRANAMRTKKK